MRVTEVAENMKLRKIFSVTPEVLIPICLTIRYFFSYSSSSTRLLFPLQLLIFVASSITKSNKVWNNIRMCYNISASAMNCTTSFSGWCTLNGEKIIIIWEMYGSRSEMLPLAAEIPFQLQCNHFQFFKSTWRLTRFWQYFFFVWTKMRKKYDEIKSNTTKWTVLNCSKLKITSSDYRLDLC